MNLKDLSDPLFSFLKMLHGKRSLGTLAFIT